MQQLKISAEIIKHSHTRSGARIATMSLIYPRFIHAEAKTHRIMSIDGVQYEAGQDISLMNESAFSRNAMSSRAVPVAKMIAQVREQPAMPIHWGANQPGMQANGEVDDKSTAEHLWGAAACAAADIAAEMNMLGLHKQVVNRILEPFQWMHTIVTATEWDNFFKLRCHDAAEPNMRALAEAMRDALTNSTPAARDFHLPYFDDAEFTVIDNDVHKACMISAARCARVSYLNHDGSTPDYVKDLALATTLMDSGHASPFEHVAFAASEGTRSRNFVGWSQFRETIGL